MTPTTRDETLKAIWEAPDAVRPLMMAEAARHLAARQQAYHALDARVTQSALLLMAAGAVAATLAFGGEDHVVGRAWAAVAAFAFAVGGVVAMLGVQSGLGLFPGPMPGWWLDVPNFHALKPKDADYALAGQMHEVMESLHRAAARRARCLNVGLGFGAAGAGAMAVAGLAAQFG